MELEVTRAVEEEAIAGGGVEDVVDMCIHMTGRHGRTRLAETSVASLLAFLQGKGIAATRRCSTAQERHRAAAFHL